MSDEFTLSGSAVPEAFTAALLHHQEGRFSEAESIYRAILAVDPDNVVTHDALGKTLMAKGDMPGAKACYLRAIALDPGFDQAHYHLGNLLLGQGMVEDAVASYKRAIALKPDFAAALYALIHATAFFRDPDMFERLAVRMRSRLNATTSAGAKVSRIWVPACSTGQEVYSIAILMTELTDGMPAAPRVELIGTDISTPALQRARTGYYRGQPHATISEQRLQRFFILLDGGYQVCNSVREMCVFYQHDLTKAPPLQGVDLISCRNVISFRFEPELQQSILRSLHAALNPDGFLVLGKWEALSVPKATFRTNDPDQMIFTRDYSASRSC